MRLKLQDQAFNLDPVIGRGATRSEEELELLKTMGVVLIGRRANNRTRCWSNDRFLVV